MLFAAGSRRCCSAALCGGRASLRPRHRSVHPALRDVKGHRLLLLIAALIAVIETLREDFTAVENARKGIRVNAIAPGGVDTAIWEGGADFQASVAAIGREATLKAMAKTTPLGRFASSEEMADSILYLLSDAAANITGHVMVSDGGFTL